MAVTALVGVLMMLGVVDVLMGVDLSFMLMRMDMLISSMATHFISPPSSYLEQYITSILPIKPFLPSI